MAEREELDEWLRGINPIFDKVRRAGGLRGINSISDLRRCLFNNDCPQCDWCDDGLGLTKQLREEVKAAMGGGGRKRRRRRRRGTRGTRRKRHTRRKRRRRRRASTRRRRRNRR